MCLNFSIISKISKVLSINESEIMLIKCTSTNDELMCSTVKAKSRIDSVSEISIILYFFALL